MGFTPPPWTDDPVIAAHRFTNAYRAADRVSQYLIRSVIYEGDQDVEEAFFRTLLFKLFNRIETWERLKTAFGNARKHRNHLALLDLMMRTGAPACIECSRSLEKVFNALRLQPSLGDFLAFHLAIDLNAHPALGHQVRTG